MSRTGRNISLLAICVAIGAAGVTALMSRTKDQPAIPLNADCKGALTGRVLAISPSTVGFGAVQGQPPLPLKAGEYVLTIDDGPNPATTKELLGILDTNCIHATFFMVGKNADAHPDLAKMIVAEGHGVGSHSYTHASFGKMTADQMHAEILKGDAAVTKAAYGAAPAKGERLFRFPGAAGVSNTPTPDMMAFLKSQRLVLGGYDASPEDWRNSVPDESFARLFARLPDRGVIVMHDWPSNTPELLRKALVELTRRKARIVTLQLKD